MAISESSETEAIQGARVSPEGTRKPQNRLRKAAVAAGSLLFAGAAGAGIIALNHESPEEAFTARYVDSFGCLGSTPYDPMYNPEFSVARRAGELVLMVNPTIVTFISEDNPDLYFAIDDNWLGSTHITGVAEYKAEQTNEALAYWDC